MSFWCGNGMGEKMRITSTGNVGIGTNTPNCALEVHGGAGSNDEVLILSNKKDDAASEWHSIFTLGGQHYDVYYNSTIQNGKSTSNGGPFHLNYYSGGNVSLCGNGYGNVGIGKTSHSTLLQIKGNGDSNNVQLLIENESYNKGIQFQYKSASGSSYNFPQARIWTSGSSYDTKLYFSTAKGSSNSNTVLSTAMTIDYDGNVSTNPDNEKFTSFEVCG